MYLLFTTADNIILIHSHQLFFMQTLINPLGHMFIYPYQNTHSDLIVDFWSCSYYESHMS